MRRWVGDDRVDPDPMGIVICKAFFFFFCLLGTVCNWDSLLSILCLGGIFMNYHESNEFLGFKLSDI